MLRKSKESNGSTNSGSLIHAPSWYQDGAYLDIPSRWSLGSPTPWCGVRQKIRPSLHLKPSQERQVAFEMVESSWKEYEYWSFTNNEEMGSKTNGLCQSWHQAFTMHLCIVYYTTPARLMLGDLMWFHSLFGAPILFGLLAPSQSVWSHWMILFESIPAYTLGNTKRSFPQSTHFLQLFQIWLTRVDSNCIRMYSACMSLHLTVSYRNIVSCRSSRGILTYARLLWFNHRFFTTHIQVQRW